MSNIITIPDTFRLTAPNQLYTSKAVNANNTTASITLWTLTGAVVLVSLYGIVETTLGSSHTTAFFRLNDGTNTPVITAATGATLSSFTDNSMMQVGVTPAAVLNVSNAGTNPSIPSSASSTVGCGTTLLAKSTATTTLEYRYTTTNTPTSGQIGFYCTWFPLSAGSTLA